MTKTEQHVQLPVSLYKASSTAIVITILGYFLSPFKYWYQKLVTTETVLLQTEGDMRSADMDLCLVTWSNWLAQCVGKMWQILHCDWIPERRIGCALGITRCFSQEGSSLCHVVNPLLTKFARSRRLDIVLVLVSCVYGPIRRTSTLDLLLRPGT